jgi:FkbM family methyltransferase
MFLNPHVYQQITDNHMDQPTIPVALQPSYAQAYEDVILEGLLRAYMLRTKKMMYLVFFEIGANHPVATSASFLLKQKMGIHTVLVEANPDLIPQLRQHRHNDTIINVAVTDQDVATIPFYLSPDNEISSLNADFVKAWKEGTVSETIHVPAIRINSLFAQMQIPKHVDIILSIDIEGYDYNILADLDFTQYKPLIIMVEPSEEFAPGTIAKMMELLESKGYYLYSQTFVNLIFMAQE